MILEALRAGAVSAGTLLCLRELGVCMRCCMRFDYIEDSSVYAESDEKILQAVQDFATESGVVVVDPQQVSGSWHGRVNETGVLADVQQLAEKGDYDVRDFALNIKLPGVVLLREYSLLRFIHPDTKKCARKTPFDLKDVLKSLLAPSISRILANAECVTTGKFAVLLDIKHDESVDEVRQIPAIEKQLEGSRKRGRGPLPVFDGFGAVSRALAALQTMPETIKSPPTRLTTTPHAVITFERDPVYMQGRYLKFQRGLSQTPWVLDGERLGESSVEECIGEIALPFFRGSGYKFHTAGREDVDVRMLGNGRPFILEILDAKKAYLEQFEYDHIQKVVNDTNRGAVEIVQAKSSSKDYFAGLQAGADSKMKTYCCVVWSENALTPDAIASINAIHDLTIEQQTPVRVLHRRTQMTRPKTIHSAKCEVLNKHYMLLRLSTSAGTYVKEFVHGDRGRTTPNVASMLGCDADIIQLDVESLIDAQ